MTARQPPDIGMQRPAGAFHDVGPRAASGLALAAAALGFAWLGGSAFALLVAAVSAVMGWEWGRIVRRSDTAVPTIVHAVSVVLAVGLVAAGQLMLAGVALLVGTIATAVASWGREPGLSALGVLYVGIPAVFLVMLRSDAGYGFAAVLLVLLVVWAVDIAAFIGGRSIGGPKLWPAVSPNKTWAGFVSGVLAGVAAGALLGGLLGAPLAQVLPVAFLLGTASQGGDLAESALKREFGVKDSSRLIPGHGGFLDRLDGVVAAATLAGLIGLVANVAAPARALLFGV
jgi:phosphatidate cytidylyltransferase